MKKFLLLTALLATTSHAETFGKLTLAESSARPLKTALGDYKDKNNTPILVKGSVKQICEKEGCWMTLEDQGESVRVFFKNHSFFVTQKIKNKPALAEGVLHKKVRTVAQQKHFLQDAGASAKEIEAVKADKIFFELEASGIKSL